MRLILALCVRLDEENIEHFVNTAWEATSPNQASRLGAKLFLNPPSDDQLMTGPGSFGQAAQAIRRMKDMKGPQAKEALKQEIQKRKRS
ncbi:TPA: hypothetical protein DCL28_05020 [Candidatus Komeilibacteria bacterium]|nr:MAG: hypothetical protein UW91_C0027G0018 [Parcubacteria group bacterium GW2011_GWF2_45_11]KKT96591.1 MAG: hypothetical protein UW98_C0039G0014 [Parcubacteria group bacterium GW2011_GWC2_45_15]OGY94327.1 MAG: hypothetical protein A3J95_00985 [Candidatus Komeilibacteria bacterium RIFOXYC2_FULL_45_12]HAH04885.1 hypothetical protein [Candidatus Komeilibacteria bacterium]HBV02259.1 hypothetical protein [Candidatus Komeilibacteria bacterium]